MLGGAQQPITAHLNPTMTPFNSFIKLVVNLFEVVEQTGRGLDMVAFPETIGLVFE